MGILNNLFKQRKASTSFVIFSQIIVSYLRLKKAITLALFNLAVASAGFAQTITFDDLASTPFGQPHALMPAGYAGFDWDNFRVLNASGSVGSGYHNGVVSPDNVLYTVNGSPSQFTNAAAFDLVSAYVMSAWNDGLQMEVQGYVGATMAYDNFYTVNTTGSTFITFNYSGVTRVRFIPSGGTLNPAYQFTGNGTIAALDNLTVAAASVPISPPRITGLAVSAGNVVLIGDQGPTNRSYYVLVSADATLPPAQWARIATNQFDSGGHFAATNAIDPNSAASFYLLQVP